MKTAYIILSPDGFPFEMNKAYLSHDKAIARAREIINERYTKQGYYSTANRERLTLDEAFEQCTVLMINPTRETEIIY